ncbi:hypothetical protein C0Q70_11047 [Pomacea canaliculata]|uniref:G-protein coupled receptors family 1 profile domain-containing protein n=1 Tax=Pomacea canaliculata TaxID=400727 RepID=A0A2T7P4W2_POMCA|nr:hypothetical protein C0Q70_11047 [Pomacea canaliculata]
MSTLPFRSATRNETQADGEVMSSVTSSTTPEGCLVLQSFSLVPWENPEDLVTADVENLVDRIKAAIVVPLVCIIVAWATAFVSVVIASERCFCIYFPLRAQNFIKTKTMAIFLALSCIFITLGFYVVSEKYNMICVYDVERNVTFWQLITTTSYYVQHRNLVDIFDSTVYGFCLPAIFNVTVAACSVAMILKLKKTLSWRDKASSAMSTKEALLTKMLVCLSIQYNIFSSPNFCIRSAGMFESGLSGSGKYFNTFMLMREKTSLCTGGIEDKRKKMEAKEKTRSSKKTAAPQVHTLENTVR